MASNPRSTASPHVVVMVTSSYPRFPGDIVGTFMEPIAHGVAARGHVVHVIAPWHPRITRPAVEGGVHFHFYRYAPHPSLNVFGYAGALREDVALRTSAWLAAPFALLAGWHAAKRVAREVGATVMHGHWVIPGGATAWLAQPSLPLVVSLHGSDVYVAERHAAVGRVARQVFEHADWVTACSEDLRRRALNLGASRDASNVVPYGVDAQRFGPSLDARHAVRRRMNLADDVPVVAAVGRFVRKKGFEYLVEAMGRLAAQGSRAVLVLGGDGDLDAELRERATRAGAADRILFAGRLEHHQVAELFAAADVVAVPSVRDDAGNVDGLPNVVMEALASSTPVVATPAGGIGAVIRQEETGVLVAERDAEGLARALATLIADPQRRTRLGQAARADVVARFGWAEVARQFEAAYDAARETHHR